MRTIADKLDYLATTKADIKSAIIAKGVSVADGTKFRDYPGLIATISGGGSTGNKLVIKNASHMFNYSWGLTIINFPDILDFSQCSDMSYMFNWNPDLTEIKGLDTSGCNNFNVMLCDCPKLADVSFLDLTNAQDVSSMCSGCTSITTFNFKGVTNISNCGTMFSGCSNLLTVTNLDFTNARSIGNMFYGCSKLNSLAFVGADFCINASDSQTLDLSYCNFTNTGFKTMLNTVPTCNNNNSGVTVSIRMNTAVEYDSDDLLNAMTKNVTLIK